LARVAGGGIWVALRDSVTNKPVWGTVSLFGKQFGGYTDSRGGWRVGSVAGGADALRGRAVGYEARVESVVVHWGRVDSLMVRLLRANMDHVIIDTVGRRPRH